MTWIQKFFSAYPNKDFPFLWQFLVSSRTIMRLWHWTRDDTGIGLLITRLVTRGKQRPADVAGVVCPLVPVHDVWRLTDPDSFFDLSVSDYLFSLSTTLASSQRMAWSNVAVWSVTVLLLKHVSNDFCSDWVYICIFLMFTQSHVEFSARFDFISVRIYAVGPEPSMAAFFNKSGYTVSSCGQRRLKPDCANRKLIRVFVGRILRLD